jgi:hypothetical protein
VPAATRANIGEEEYLKRIENLVVGEDPRQGFARNGIFYHPVQRFQMPLAQGWKLDNQHAAVVMADPDGQGMMGLRLAPGARARDAAMQFAQQSKVQIVTSGDTAVNGLPTTVIIGQATTDQGAVGVWNAFIEYNGKVYSLLGYAPQQLFERFRPTFESVAAGFSPLREQSVVNAQPARLKLVRADRNAPFSSFIPTALPPEMTADELAIMNQMTLNDTVNEGRILKIPETPPQPQIAAQPTSTTAAYPDQRSSYPPQQGYPQTNYPPQQPYPAPTQPYPPQTSYPQQQPYPQPSPSYPAQGYPQPTYPQQTYPQPTYPPPGQTQTYPPASTYPPSQPAYPQQPGSTYPAQSGTTYPQPSGAGYPQQTYPQPGYPQNYPPSGTTNTAPPAHPQFPQPPSANQNRTTTPQQQPPQQPQQPVGPRCGLSDGPLGTAGVPPATRNAGGTPAVPGKLLRLAPQTIATESVVSRVERPHVNQRLPSRAASLPALTS